ncbi:MAG: sarcosine oxidase subunit gamma [Acidimicrobiales bacterium]
MVARSPITARGPVGRAHGWEVSTAAGKGGLELCDLSPYAKVVVRAGARSKAAEVLGCPLGRARRVPDGTLVAGTGPGEWLLFSGAGTWPLLADEVGGGKSDDLTTVVDVTHGGFLIRLSGAESRRVLEKVCAIDLSDGVTPDGAVFRSSVARIVCDVIRDDDGDVCSYLLHGDRSAGQYLFDAVLDAGSEFSIGISGYKEKEA